MLKAGGLVAVSDVVVQGELPAGLGQSVWAVSRGELEETTYRRLLSEAGFSDIGVEVSRVYYLQDLAASDCCGLQPGSTAA